MEKNRRVGRPRAFDPDLALRCALVVFWERGYEGASMTTLQEAMDLTAPQIYRAFGSKEQLFERAVRLYLEEYSFAIRADIGLVEALVEYLDRAAKEFTTEPGRGCLVSTGLLATGRDAEMAAAVVRAERNHALNKLRERITDGVERGELPGSVTPEGLARTVGALIQGMSVQARDGASYTELAGIVASGRTLLTELLDSNSFGLSR